MTQELTLWTGPLLPLLALLWPLSLAVLAALPMLQKHPVRLLPLAPLPALLLPFTPNEAATAVPDLLLGVTLQMDAGGRLLLALTATLWLIAGLAAQAMTAKPHGAIFTGFWCVTFAGNLGVFLARDIATFYVAFAAVSLAAWFLVVHERTEAAQRAGRVYIVMALLGEVCLLLGLILGADAADSLSIAAVQLALTGQDAPVLALPLLVAGFGIKAGLVPLHVWLPLAHPAAPVPASAVLSGAIVKAGLYGMIQFLPVAQDMLVLLWLGVAGGFLAALWGLTQSNPKAVLAYSTISQMGLMILMVAAGGKARDTVPYFALHHGFAKGALFLLCGVMLVAATRTQRLLCLAVAAIVAASVAGAPLTGGALAKTAIKAGLSDDASLILSVSSVTTTMVLIWFLYRLWSLEQAERTARLWSMRLFLPFAAGALALGLPWLLWSGWSESPATYNLEKATLFDAVWPVLLALLPAAVLLRFHPPQQPPGDLLLILSRIPPVSVPRPALPVLLPDPQSTLTTLVHKVTAVEARLLQWQLSGALLVGLVLVLSMALLS